MHPTSRQLVAWTAEGDQRAFAALYDAMAPRVLGLIVAILGTHRDADDVLQEVFREAWMRAARYDAAVASPESWLLMIARSRAIDQLRRRRRDKTMFHAKPIADDSTDSKDVATIDTPTFRQSNLHALPGDQRDAVQLAFFRGLTCQQIADHQGVPLGTAKTRLRLGMQKLRELMTHTEALPS